MKVYVHPALYMYLFCMVAVSSWETCVGAMLALTIHEFGHCSASCFFKEKIERLTLTPFGGVLTYAHGKIPCKGIRGACIAVSGPAANYLLLYSVETLSEWLGPELVRSIILSNVVMLLLNLLPALPLDGGRLLFCLGYYFLPAAALISCLSWMGVLSGVLLIFLATYGIISLRILNCSLMIVGCHLSVCAWKSRSHMILENLYAVIQETGEKKAQVRGIKTYKVPLDMQIIHLLPFLSNRFDCEFITETGAKEFRIQERELCQYILEQPLFSIREIWAQKEKDR